MMRHRFMWVVLSLAVMATTANAQTRESHGAFMLQAGADTIVFERFTRSGDTVQGSISIKGAPRQDYLAVLTPDRTVKMLSLNVFTSDIAGSAPAQSVMIVTHGDSLIMTTGGKSTPFLVPSETMFLMNNSFALFELFTERARQNGGSADIRAWALSGAVAVDVSLRPIGTDSMTLAVAGQLERLRVDSVGRILGGSIPSQRLLLTRLTGEAANMVHLGRPSYAAPAGAPYTATEVSLNGPGGFTLGGTLTLPAGMSGRLPAVVTITGSGQQDRDEYIPVAGGYRPFFQVADTLGRRGIAVLRLDDRTIGMSAGSLGTSADYANDIRAAVAYLRTRPEIDPDRIALLGHSEGGMIAPMVAVTDPRLKGIVLLAGPALTGNDIIHFQQRNAITNEPSIPPAARDSLIRAAAATLDTIGRKDVWMGYFLAYDPLPTARKVKTPALILQGETDHQVTPDQAPMLADAMRAGGNRDVTMKIFPGLNHLFVPDPSGQPAGYAALKNGRVTPEVLGTLTDWLATHLRAGQ